MNLKLAWLFLQAIPDIIKILQAIEEAQKEVALGKKVNDDLKVIHQAIATKDPAKLTALFSNAADPGTPAS